MLCFAAFFVLICFLASCNNTKYIPQDQSLLIKNKITLKQTTGFKDRRPLMDEIFVIPTQKPNKSILGGLRIKLWLYNSVDSSKANKRFNNWLKYKLG